MPDLTLIEEEHARNAVWLDELTAKVEAAREQRDIEQLRRVREELLAFHNKMDDLEERVKMVKAELDAS